MDTAVLKDIGLDDYEIKVYLALLQEGASAAMAISRKTKVERTTVYRVLESLIDKGLASFIVENEVKKFKAVEPEKLLVQLREKEEELKKVLPELNNLSKLKGTEPNIEIYRGLSGVKSMIRDILVLKKDYVTILAEKELDELSLFFRLFMKSIEKENIHERALIKEGSRTYKSKNTEIRYLPKNHRYSTGFGVCGNLVGIVLLAEPFLAIKIESKELADTFRSYFEILWKVAKR
ncbi:HTH-type sugar sensing transcriptional regulator TrmBL1 [uncultured archaeon]|nr:HTH-type sugar sensing transcriptional regulator TrmBL1 [uncultured archaeon]